MVLVSGEPYADAVASLLGQGYEPQDVTLPEVVQQALDSWLRERITAAMNHHAATTGNGHYPQDRCESWYALEDALCMMHDNSRTFVQELLKPKVTP